MKTLNTNEPYLQKLPNIIDLSGKTKKLWSGQASLRRSRRSGRKNQTKTIEGRHIIIACKMF
jgi:hypothetical protein